MTPTSIQIRVRIAGGFATAQISREEKKNFDKRAQMTLRTCEEIVELKQEYFEHILHGIEHSQAYLVEKIGTLMRLGEQARVLSGDYARMFERHEALCKAYHSALQNRRLPVSLRQDIADAHEQHSGLVKDLAFAKTAEEESYQTAQNLLKKLESRLMALYPTPGFPVFALVDALMHEEEIAEEYGEGEITLDEALALSAENDSWQPTRH